MNPKVIMAGMAAAAIAGGTAFGAALETTPLTKASHSVNMAPKHRLTLSDPHSSRAIIAPRDQYALVTSDGRVEVAELSARGVYRSRQYDDPIFAETMPASSETESLTDGNTYRPDPTFADREILAYRAERAAEDARRIAISASAPAEPVEPLPLAEPVEISASAPAVRSRTINVEAELAAAN